MSSPLYLYRTPHLYCAQIYGPYLVRAPRFSRTCGFEPVLRKGCPAVQHGSSHVVGSIKSAENDLRHVDLLTHLFKFLTGFSIVQWSLLTLATQPCLTM